MKQYVILSPPWETTSGGVRVMYGLYGWLLAKGQVVFLNEKPTHGDIVAIYPEIQQGNPVHAQTVVRYILNKPGVVPALYTDGTIKQGPTEFDPDDKLYYFSRLFSKSLKEKFLFLPIVNLHLFKDLKRKRNKTCYFVGKGVNMNLHPENAIPIDRKFASDQSALCELLNECDFMYAYDPVSAMYEIARLCGCKVILLQNTYTEYEWDRYEPGRDGVAFGRSQIEGLTLNVEKFRNHYEGMVKKFSLDLDQFIEDTQ